MSTAARESLREVVDRLGSSLLRHVAGELDTHHRVEEVIVHGIDEPLAVTPGAIVFAVGGCPDGRAATALDGEGIAGLLRELGAAGAAALVMRSPVSASPEVLAAAAESGVALLGLVEGAPWMYLADVIRPTRGWREEDGVATAASLSADLNLFKVANSLSEILDAPVTIEDPRSRVVAFSADQERGDAARKASVLGQQVPPHLSAQMVRLGVFQRLYTSDRPVRIQSLSSEVRPRVAMQIRAGNTLLGSIWAIAGDEPLTEAQEDAMARAANTAAAAILQGRIAGDTIQRLRASTVAALIGGGQGARAAAGRALRGRPRSGCVIAVRVRSDDSLGAGAALMVDAERLASSLVLFLRSERTAAVAAVVEDTIYAVLLSSSGVDVDVCAARDRLQTFLERRGPGFDELMVGVGNPIGDPADLDRSREDAELVLRVLDMPGAVRCSGAQVATRDDVHGLSLVLRLSDIAAADPVSPAGPLANLEAYDTEHQSKLVETLRCWLEQFGDVSATAEQLHVHKNTLRYRLGRIEEVSGVSLTNASERFELMLQFRVRQSLGASRPVVETARRTRRAPLERPELGVGFAAGVS